MITRVVKLTIAEEKIPDFEKIFDQKMRLIRTHPGCESLTLYKSNKEDNVFFTISQWNAESDLNAYRRSKLFGEIWPVVKTYFVDQPVAYSLEELINVD